MKKKIFYTTLFFALIAINVILSKQKNDYNLSYCLSIANIQAQANPEGVQACYSSMVYNGPLMPGKYYEIVYGNKCYSSGTECGRQQSCNISGRGSSSSYCYDLSC